MQNSTIEWTDHTFNPWIGCSKVNALCTHCYAETMMATRYKRVRWGPKGTRSRTSPDNWRKPLTWNRKALYEGTRRRIFCASLADIYEDRDELDVWRKHLFEVIDATPQLDWLTLTKRPENIGRMLADIEGIPLAELMPRNNMWLGTSVGNQQTAELAVPHLTKWRQLSPILFLSVEPLLGPIPRLPLDSIDWVIVGGESGPLKCMLHQFLTVEPSSRVDRRSLQQRCHLIRPGDDPNILGTILVGARTTDRWAASFG